ncbi:MAG TPA: hypothetical protein PLL12_11155, partial [Aestuariivirga sp.]|nr:hypothetical protein [Aestuariivirga sp.]
MSVPACVNTSPSRKSSETPASGITCAGNRPIVPLELNRHEFYVSEVIQAMPQEGGVEAEA